MLSSVPKSNKVAIVPYGENKVLDKLHSGVSYSAIGHEFNVNESTIYIKKCF